MLKNCKASTLMFGAMLITGAALYGMRGSLLEATSTLAVVVGIIFSILLILDMRYFSSIVLVAVSEVTMLAFGLHTHTTDGLPGLIMFLAGASIVVLIVSFAPAAVIRDEGDKEHPMWLQALAAIPGIGGAILLCGPAFGDAHGVCCTY